MTINGNEVLKNFDIFAAAGGQNIAVIEQFPVTAASGSISINITNVLDNAIICSIEVLKP